MSNYPVTVEFFGNVVRAQTQGSLICLNDLFIAGNALRLAQGKPALQMNAFLNSKGFEEYLEAASDEWNIPAEQLRKVEGRGRNTKTYVHASIALLAAESMSPRFHAHIHRVFIEGKLLEFRELGGTEFKVLNAAIDAYLPNRDGKDNRGVYIQVAKMLRTKILGEGSVTADWNSTGVAQTHVRYQIEADLSKMLRLGLVRDYDHLKELIEKL
jgi:hypothetical protein